MKKKFNEIIAFLLALIIIFISLSIAIDISSQDLTFYSKFQREYSIDKESGRNFEDLKIINKDLVDYLKYGENTLLEKHFNDREVRHMEDVYKLFQLKDLVFNISATVLVIILIYYNYRRSLLLLLKLSRKHLLIILSLIVVFVLIVAMNFNRAFILFHKVFFNNDLWLLDPETDLMIRMLPENFFVKMAINIFIRFLVYIGLYTLIVYFYEKAMGTKGGICSIQEVE